MFAGVTWAGQSFAAGNWAPPVIPPPFTYNTVTVDPDFAYVECGQPPLNPDPWLPDEFGGKCVIAGSVGDLTVNPDFAYVECGQPPLNANQWLPDDFDSQHLVVTPDSL
jgi:hypothetical protein